MHSPSPIIIIGSSNTDMVVKTSQLPLPGQTVSGGAFFMNAGGKGANQAVAAARLGGHVTFVAKVGEDVFGQQAVEGFGREGIDCRYIFTDPSAASGVALITVDEQGENCIAVAPGANALLRVEDVQRAREAIQQSAVMLLQLEIPLEVVTAAVSMGAALGKWIILNPAPACPLPDELLRQVAVLTPNEQEVLSLTGERSVEQAAKVLLSRGVDTVIVTMGAQGALVCVGDGCTLVAAPVVTAVDTTAAGDVFNGALAVGLAEGMEMTKAVAFANRAAALSVTKLGAQASAPGRMAVEEYFGRE